MPQVVSKYLIPVMECLARLYNGVEPVGIRSLQLCMNSRGVRDVNYTYRGLEAGVRLGLVKEVLHGKSVRRFMPTLDGVVKGAVLGAVFDVLGVVGNDALEYMYPLVLFLYSSLVVELPGLVASSVVKPRRRSNTVRCCDDYGRCVNHVVVPSREGVYFGMIILKALAGIPVRGLKPTDYGELYYFTKSKVINYLQQGLAGIPPNTPASQLTSMFIRAIARVRLAQRLVEAKMALGIP
jgi:hypothetical protein